MTVKQAVFGIAGMGVVAALGVLAVRERRHRARRLAQMAQGRPPGIRVDDGVRLHLEVDGPREAGITVIFVHGFAVNMDAFDGQRASLRRRARLVLFDQRGHGSSGWSGPRSATVERLGRDLGEVVDQAGGKGPIVLVGHSLGGMAILAAALQRPELFGGTVCGVALLSTSAGRLGLGLPRPLAHLLLSTGVARLLAWFLWLLAPLHDRLDIFRTPLVRRWLRSRLFGADPVPPELVSRISQMWARTSRSMASAFYPSMLYHDKDAALDVLSRVSTLVLAGTEDRTIPSSHSRHIAGRIGNSAHLVLVPLAGHMVTMTHAAAVNDALGELVQRAEKSAAVERSEDWGPGR